MNTGKIVSEGLVGFFSGAAIGIAWAILLVLPALAIGGIQGHSWHAAFSAATLVAVISVVSGAAIGCLNAVVKEERRQRMELKAAAERREAERNAEAQARRAFKAELTGLLSSLLSTSRATFARLSSIVAEAEAHLDRAEKEFAEGAFAPFWDEVERATQELGRYRNGIIAIKRNAMQYQDKAANAPFKVSAFSLPAGDLADGRSTAARLAAIVRKGQKDFQFATIYEQRKTNKILVAGFSTLASAIYQIGDAISGAMTDLSTSLGTSLDELLDATRVQTEEARSASVKHAELLRDQGQVAEGRAAERRKFERTVARSQKRQEEMLDNIQRRRKPLL